MQEEIAPYLNRLSNSVKERISDILNDEAEANVIIEAFNFHFNEAASLAFQKYYFETINNRADYLDSEKFFARFKKQYSLQAIDNDYLNRLERQKERILLLVDQGDITKLYFDYFANAQIKHRDKLVSRNLGSFFSKFVHTFKPNDYCALDNPIKNYFGLKGESFYVAFLIVSNAYNNWVNENSSIIENIRTQFELDDKRKLFSLSFTHIKLLDLVFWFIANKRLNENPSNLEPR